jgi:ferredoxin-thioredoxin reductase catalytic subunit
MMIKIDMESEEFKNEMAKTQKFTDKVCESRGWVYHPIEDVNEGVTMGLTRNKMIYNKRFCPCFMVVGETKEERKAADNRICPCKPAIEKLNIIFLPGKLFMVAKTGLVVPSIGGMSRKTGGSLIDRALKSCFLVPGQKHENFWNESFTSNTGQGSDTFIQKEPAQTLIYRSGGHNGKITQVGR